MTNQVSKLDDQKQNIDYFKNLAKVAVSSGNYAGIKEAEMINLMMSAQALGVDPMKAINGGFYIVKGKVIMSTALMADRIRKGGHSIKIVDWSREKCVIIGVRKDNGDSVKVEYSMEDAALAGLADSPTWKKFPKNMLYNRAMSTLARVLFSDILGMSYSEDESHDIRNIKPEERAEIGVEMDAEAFVTLENINCEVEKEFKSMTKDYPFQDKLKEYVDFCCKTHGLDPFDLMKGANSNAEKFKRHYDKWLLDIELSLKKEEVSI